MVLCGDIADRWCIACPHARFARTRAAHSHLCTHSIYMWFLSLFGLVLSRHAHRAVQVDVGFAYACALPATLLLLHARTPFTRTFCRTASRYSRRVTLTSPHARGDAHALRAHAPLASRGYLR